MTIGHGERTKFDSQMKIDDKPKPDNVNHPSHYKIFPKYYHGGKVVNGVDWAEEPIQMTQSEWEALDQPVKFNSQMKIDDKPAQKTMHELYPKYYRDVSKLESIDYYRLVDLFGITDANVAHSFKKLLLAGNRTGNKSFRDDIIEARDTLNRRIEMWAEDEAS